jgi:serine/threonine protein kinase
MTDVNTILHGYAFDEMDISETSYSYEDFLQPMHCEHAEGARCISIDSDASPRIVSIRLPSAHKITDGRRNIAEDYVICPEILGSGHYGCVRECQHRSTGAKYAVKTIDKSKVNRLDHIQREIDLLRSIDHPGIMKMIDCYEDSNYVHIVTEKYNGGELFDMIINNTSDYGCLREHQAANIIKSLLEAVEYLHSHDIVHRDIKPENILFESNDEGSSVKLIDFGLSRRHRQNDSDMTNQVGTSYYMSPAILRGKYDRSVDLWAVGIVSYVMLCGYPPFNGSSDFEVQTSILRDVLVFEEEDWGRLSNSSRDFVSKLLCTDPAKILTAADALRHPWIAGA